MASQGNANLDANTCLLPNFLTATNTPKTTNHWFIFQFFWDSANVSLSSPRAQMALGYNINGVYYRRFDGTNWTAWQSCIDTNTKYGLASSTANGLMSAGDKSKLDGLKDINNTPLLGAFDSHFYVSTSGVDSVGRGSQSSPFRTIRYAIEYISRYVNARMTHIHVGAGTYNESLEINNRYQCIKLLGDNNNPLLTGGILSNNGSNVHVENFRLRIDYNSSINNYTANNLCWLALVNCTFLDGVNKKSLDWYSYINANMTSIVRVENCTFDGVDLSISSWGIYFVAKTHSTLHLLGNLTFKNNCKMGNFISTWNYAVTYQHANLIGTLTGEKFCFADRSIAHSNGRGVGAFLGTADTGYLSTDSVIY